MKISNRFKGQLKLYMQWPYYMAVLLLLVTAWMYGLDIRAGVAMTIIYAVYIIAIFSLFVLRRQKLTQSLIDFASGYAQIQKVLLDKFTVPYGLLDETGKIVWLNAEFQNLISKDSYNKNIKNVFSDVDLTFLSTDQDSYTVPQVYNDRDYRVVMKKVFLDGLESDSSLDFYDDAPYFVAVYLFDETDMNTCMKELHDEQFVAGLIYIDNYDEALESVDEVRRSLLIALVDRKINKYINAGNGVVKKLEKDKYLVVFRYKYLSQLREDRFSILEEVKSVNIGNEMAITLSIGIGASHGSYLKNYEMARASIDLALGRGGDQAVVREADKVTYYGGKSTTVEKNTRVKARVKAQALRGLIDGTDNVIIMGHKISDVDALGAAIGIYRAARTFDKKANIVLNEITTSLQPLVELYKDNPDYDKNLFVTSEEAPSLVTQNTLLVVVDVNKPSYTECPELISKCKTVVVLDHHRQGSEPIDNAVLSYIEPYASSTCEMVAEILQYIGDNVRLKTAEADTIYSGIVIDTNNFTNKAGVRTFEAAAFIRRSGADIIRVRKLLRNDMAEYKARAEAVRHAEVYKDAYAISVCPSTNLKSPTIVGAQAANELLNIAGIKASIVLTYFNDEVYISARSIDEVNVQLIMERLGGGGHISIAGAQLKDCDIEEAITIVKNTIDEMLKEGSI